TVPSAAIEIGFDVSGSFPLQPFGEHDLNDLLRCLLARPVALELARERNPTDGLAAGLDYTLQAGAMSFEGGTADRIDDGIDLVALAEPDRLVLPFAMTSAGKLLEALPRHETAHAALLTDILDVVHGASLTANEQSSSPQTEELSPSELRVLRYLPTNL